MILILNKAIIVGFHLSEVKTMLYLIASFVALLAGPLCYRYLASSNGLQKGLDGFIFVSLGGLVLIHILPELIEHGGWLSLLFVIIGIWGPTASEKVFHRYSDITHKLTLYLGVLGLLLHTLTDGGALVLADQPNNSHLLALGIILHRLPVGIAIWWLLKPQVGSKAASVVLGVMMAMTALGYLMGQHWLVNLSLDNTVYLQAFVTGSILHVVLHQPHVEHVEDKQGNYEYHAGVGSIIGIALLIMLLTLDKDSAHQHDFHIHNLEAFWGWLLSITPVIVLTLIAAAIRFYLKLTPNTEKNHLGWFQKLIGPEMWLFSFLVLGLEFLYVHVLVSLMVYAVLVLTKEKPQLNLPYTSHSPIHFALANLIDRSAPFIVFFILGLNIIGEPSGLLASPLMQLLLLSFLFISLRLNCFSAVIIASCLYFQHWHIVAVLFTLVVAPLLYLSQLRKLGLVTIFSITLIVIGSMALINNIEINVVPPITFSQPVEVLSALFLGILVASSLLRMGPRNFISQLLGIKKHVHHHH